MVNAWRMRTELGIEIAHRIYLYLVQKYTLGVFFLLEHLKVDWADPGINLIRRMSPARPKKRK